MMDVEEWELLPDDGFLEIHDDGGKKIFSRKYGISDPENLLEMNYFICPSPPKFSQFVESTHHPSNSRVPKQLLPLPIESFDHYGVVKEEVKKVPIEISITPSAISEKLRAPDIGSLQPDQDPISQVFFKKMKENEFVVDMKLDSPRSNSRGIMAPQADPGSFQFENKAESIEDGTLESKNSFPGLEIDDNEIGIKENSMDVDMKDDDDDDNDANWEENSGGLNIWKWGMNGIGAICSFGVAAAATICIIVLGGGRQKNKQHHHQHPQKLQFHIYTDDKRIKQVVRQATRLNEAISAVRGVPITRAHISFGGYYEGF